MKRHIIHLIGALAIMLSVFGATGGIVQVPTASAIESGCSYSTSVTTDGTYVWANGSFSCTTTAGSGRYRALQVCLYKQGVQEYCNYNTYTGSSGSIRAGCPHYSGGSVLWQSWVWFRDKYGATTSKWGPAVYSYNSSVC